MSSIPDGRNSNESHMSKVSAAEARSAKLQRKLKPAQLLNVQAYRNQSEKPGEYAIDGTYQAQWTRNDKRDDKYKLIRELTQGGATTEYGQVMANADDLSDWMLKKKHQEEYLLQLRLGSKLVDPKSPESQERAFALFPELKQYPDEQHKQELAVSEALRTMLRDGTVVRKKKPNNSYYNKAKIFLRGVKKM